MGVGDHVKRSVDDVDDVDSVDEDDRSFRPEDESVGRRWSNTFHKCSVCRGGA